jgi:hypothetical protein
MILPLLLLAVIAGCVVPPADRRKDTPETINAVKRHLLIPGEELTYDIKSGIFILGKVKLTIKASEANSNHLVLELLADSTHPWLPSLSYRYKSVVNKSDFSTVQFDMEEMEKSEVEKTVTFKPDYNTHVGKYTRVKHSSIKKGTLSFEEKVYDYLSVIYLLRKKMPEIGKQLEVPLYNEREILNLKIKNLTERDIVLKNGGRFRSYILKPRRDFEGIFVRKGKVLLWMDTTYHIPLKIIIKLPFGVGRIELKKAENTQSGKVFIQ